MSKIHQLSEETIDKIAAGEVVERPLSIVKELTENAIDAGASIITVEIKEGGKSLIRITDNGHGIAGDDVRRAFLRHCTSKISSAEDLHNIHSLGFRGEALSSIAAVAQVELITKTKDSLVGIRYEIAGGKEGQLQEVGAPDGTTILVRNLFFNVPVRKKFLKSDATEGSYIADIMEHLSLSRPDISFKFKMNGQTRFQTSGNGSLQDVIYRIYGKDVSGNLIPISHSEEGLSISGFLGKPEINRSNRNFEIFFVNGRYIRSELISRALEDAYKPYLMQHKYPFAVLAVSIEPEDVDVNVHPSKLEIRFHKKEAFYESIHLAVRGAFLHKELIRESSLFEKEEKEEDLSVREKLFQNAPEPFEVKRAQLQASVFNANSVTYEPPISREIEVNEKEPEIVAKQLSFVPEQFLSKAAAKKRRLIGQFFDTYWLCEYDNKLYIMDQHAAHEKVKYERFIAHFLEKDMPSQLLNPPILLSLSAREFNVYNEYLEAFTHIGFETQSVGGYEIALRAVPLDLYGCDEKSLFFEILDELSLGPIKGTPDVIHNKLASMGCKAAVKGNNALSFPEAEALFDELMDLDNPYNCPHGRPTLISFTKAEMDRKFKRIVE